MIEINKIHTGDNLEIMRDISDESIDLIYLDPPFFTQKEWRRDEHTFNDKFKNIEEYIKFMSIRLIEMRRILKPTGSIYLHCDWHASHYLKIEMDKIFGYDNFQNEIVWCYSGPSSPGMKQYARKHDIILFYSKGKEWTWNVEELRLPYSESSMLAFNSPSKLGGERSKYKENGGRYPEDYWTHIPSLKNSKETLGYPTQKPEALLERIIKASSNPGNIILDPFCGCGTTVAVAEKLGRQWIGIDISQNAINLAEKRIKEIPIKQKSLFED